MRALKPGNVLLDADASRYRECTNVVCDSAGLGSHVVSQALMRLTLGLAFLLPQEVQCRKHFGTSRVGIDFDVVADRVGRKQSHDRLRLQPTLGDQLLEHAPRVGV